MENLEFCKYVEINQHIPKSLIDQRTNQKENYKTL